MLEHRGLCEAMVRQIGPADQLKIEQALARGDPAAVEALPLQYCGTPAAALPCQWLGDRALAAADLAQAVSWYDEGLRWASPAQQPELAARKRLVSAMLGSAWGQPPTQPVSLGGVKVSPEQFEGWVRDQLSRRRIAAEAASSADSLPVVAAAQPVQFQAASFGQLDDSAGEASRQTSCRRNFASVDWSWRHLTVRAGEDSLLAVERSRITAFDLAGGKVRWEFPPSQRLVARPRAAAGLRADESTSAPPRSADRAGVVCLDGKTGRNLWLRDCGGTAASDPLWYRGRLFVFTIGPAGEQFVAPLCLVELHPETGDVLSRQQIWRPTEREKLPGECQASWAGNRLVVLVAGSVICDRPARADRLAPSGNDFALRHRPRLRSSSIASRQSNPMGGSSSSSPEVARSIALPWRQASAAGGAASSACNGSSICRTTASWRGPRGDSSP